MDNEKIVSWRDLFGNKYRFTPSHQMLGDNGYKVKMTTKLCGESKKRKIPVVVHFDEDYVVEYLANVLSNIKPSKYNDLQRLVSKAYDTWRKREIQK